MRLIKRQKSWIRTWDKQEKLTKLIFDEITPKVRIGVDLADGFVDAYRYGVSMFYGRAVIKPQLINQIMDSANLSLNPPILPLIPEIGKIDGFRIIASTLQSSTAFQFDLPFPIPRKKFQRQDKPWYRSFV